MRIWRLNLCNLLHCKVAAAADHGGGDYDDGRDYDDGDDYDVVGVYADESDYDDGGEMEGGGDGMLAISGKS